MVMFLVGPFFVVSGFIVIGFACTFFAGALQKYLIRFCERWPPIFKWYPPQKYIRTGAYRWELRVIGIVVLSFGLYHLIVLLSGL
jgi:hypothetical protein